MFCRLSSTLGSGMQRIDGAISIAPDGIITSEVASEEVVLDAVVGGWRAGCENDIARPISCTR